MAYRCFECRPTASQIQKIAKCLLLDGDGGCTAAAYLIRRLQEVLPKPYPCRIIKKETSCTRCLQRIISGGCTIYNDCQSPFYLGFKKVLEKGENAFVFKYQEYDFVVISSNNADGGTSVELLKTQKKILVPWPQVTAQKPIAQHHQNHPLQDKVLMLPPPLLQKEAGIEV